MRADRAKPRVKPQTIKLMNQDAQTLLKALDGSNEASCLGVSSELLAILFALQSHFSFGDFKIIDYCSFKNRTHFTPTSARRMADVLEKQFCL